MRTINTIKIEKETIQDVTLSRILQFLRNGWLADAKFLSVEEKVFFEERVELTIDKSCILRGTRLIIPPTLQPAVLHSSGIASISLGNY